MEDMKPPKYDTKTGKKLTADEQAEWLRQHSSAATYANAAANGYTEQNDVKQYNGYNLYGIISFILGICGFLVGINHGNSMLEVILFIVGLALGLTARSQFKNKPESAGQGKWMATAGIIINLVPFIFMVLMLVSGVAILGIAASSYGGY